jgi:membrane associated rhomboid family serine protease
MINNIVIIFARYIIQTIYVFQLFCYKKYSKYWFYHFLGTIGGLLIFIFDVIEDYLEFCSLNAEIFGDFLELPF